MLLVSAFINSRYNPKDFIVASWVWVAGRWNFLGAHHDVIMAWTRCTHYCHFFVSFTSHTASNVEFSWWRHQMEQFSALLAICAGSSPVPGDFPAQRPVTRSFDVFFDLQSDKRLSKQWWGWCVKTPSCPLLRHRNVDVFYAVRLNKLLQSGGQWFAVPLYS